MIDGYESDKLACREEEEKAKEKEMQNEEEDALKKIPKTPKYVQRNNSKEQIIGDKRKGVLTRRRVAKEEVNICLLSKVEPKIVSEACKDECWMKAMEEVHLCKLRKNQTWEIVPRPTNKNIIGTNWVFKNKLNDDGEVVRKK